MNSFVVVKTLFVMLSALDAREPDRFGLAIEHHDTIITAEITGVSVKHKSDQGTSGIVTIKIASSLQNPMNVEELKLPFESNGPVFGWPRTGWSRVIPQEGKHVLLALSCRGGGWPCRSDDTPDTTAVLNLDDSSEASWLSTIKDAIDLVQGSKRPRGEAKLLEAMSSDNSLLRSVARDTLVRDCKSSNCKAEMVDREIALSRHSDFIQKVEALYALRDMYKRFPPESPHRKKILLVWIDAISDSDYSYHAVDRLFEALADPTDPASTSKDLKEFTEHEKSKFNSQLTSFMSQLWARTRADKVQALKEALSGAAKVHE